MSDRGWVKLHRQIQDNPLWLSEPFSRGQAWVDLMMTANHKPSFIRVRGSRIEVGKGVVARTKSKLGDRWGWSRGKVLRFLSELETDNQIEQETVHGFTLITLCNYGYFQSRHAANDTQNDTQLDTPNDTPDSTRDGTTNGHETGHIQERQQQQECKESLSSNHSEILKTFSDFGFPLSYRTNPEIINGVAELVSRGLTVEMFTSAIQKSLSEKKGKGLPPWNFIRAISDSLVVESRSGITKQVEESIDERANRMYREKYGVDPDDEKSDAAQLPNPLGVDDDFVMPTPKVINP